MARGRRLRGDPAMPPMQRGRGGDGRGGLVTIGRAASHLLWHLTGLLPRLEAERRKVGVQSGSDPSRNLRSPSGARRVTLVSIISDLQTCPLITLMTAIKRETDLETSDLEP